MCWAVVLMGVAMLPMRTMEPTEDSSINLDRALSPLAHQCVGARLPYQGRACELWAEPALAPAHEMLDRRVDVR